MQFAELLKVTLNEPAGSPVELLVREKYEKYALMAQWNAVFYYTLRVVAGVCAALLPFVVSSWPSVASGLSIAVALVTVIDLIANPKFHWQLYSEATNLITIELLKKSSDYADQKELIETLLRTERAALNRLEDLKVLFDRLQRAQ